MTSGRRLLKWVGGILLLFVLYAAARDAIKGGTVSDAPGKVGLIQLLGPMMDAKKVVDQFARFGNDPAIKVIVFRVDTPGGGVAVAQEITREIERVRQKGKKVIVSMGSIAASGGYYVAAGVDMIMANPGTITGSIGVIISFANAEELMKKVGLSFEVVKSGRYKDVGSPSRKMTLDEQRILKDMIDDAYNQFVDTIVDGRMAPLQRVIATREKIEVKAVTREKVTEEVRAVAQGQIYSGAMAKGYGLVDELGSFNDAIARARQIAGLPDSAEVVEERKRFSLKDYVWGDAAESVSRVLGLDAPLVQYQLKF